MTKRLSTAFSAALAMSVLIAADSFAQVTRIDLQVVESPTFNGENFGQVGQYELLRGVVYGEADPADPRHREIVNLENAPRNPLGYRQIRVALAVALYEWVVEGVEPPASRFPSVAEGGLVPATDNGFPHIPGVIYSGSYNPLRLHEHETVPPKQGDPYTVLVRRVDRDGNMIDGVRPPNLSVPIGTHMGWNLWGEDLVERAQCRTTGSFIPFATDRAERESAGDPRASLEERYPSHEEYVSVVSQAAEALVRDRLLLPRDAKEIVDLARGSEIGRD